MTIHVKRRLWHWRCAHYWSIIRLRRRIVFGSVALGVLIALMIIVIPSPINFGRVTIIDRGVDENGVITNPPQVHVDMPGEH